jgi:hypothetical protein
MKLDALEANILGMLLARPPIDMDAVSHAGPIIAQHLNAISALCDTIPNSQNLKDKVEDLKSLFSTYLPMQGNVLEKTVQEAQEDAQRVIYNFDKEDPMNKTEVLILGGAGRISMAGLRKKAERESAQLAQDLKGDHANYRGAAHNVKQVANTINTMVAALNALSAMRSEGGANATNIPALEQRLQHPVHQSVNKLERELEKTAKAGRSLSYSAIDTIMKKISAEDGVSTGDLHNMWVASHGGWTPDQWIKQSPAIQDTGIHENQLQLQDILDQFYDLASKIGESAAWVKVRKSLKSTILDQDEMTRMLNEAVLFIENQKH